MDVAVVLAALVAAGAMLTDWSAVHSERQSIETIAKPMVMVGLIAVALLGDVTPSSLRPWLVAALALGLLGDVFLLPQVDQFLPGLASFLVGHSLYLVVFVIVWNPGPLLIVGGIGMVLLLVAFGIPIVKSLVGSPMFVPVMAYIAVTTAIIVLGAATGRWLISAGALAFALSDGLLGHDRFVRPEANHRVWVHVLYHSGQAAIVAGAIHG